jgi:hypothetical protein
MSGLKKGVYVTRASLSRIDGLNGELRATAADRYKERVEKEKRAEIDYHLLNPAGFIPS